MLTAVLIKVGFALGGVVAGWLGKKWHVQPIIDQVEAEAARRLQGK